MNEMEPLTDMVGNKMFKATFESPNSCYVQSVIVMANDVDDAKDKIYEWRNKDTKYKSETKYIYSGPMEVEIEGSVTQIGHGSNPRL
jgi:hypothetical protein